MFILDLFIPKGVADGLLYVAPVAWIALWSNRHEASLVVFVAALCTVCAIAAFLLSPPGLLWLGLANCGMAYRRLVINEETRRRRGESSARALADLFLL